MCAVVWPTVTLCPSGRRTPAPACTYTLSISLKWPEEFWLARSDCSAVHVLWVVCAWEEVIDSSRRYVNRGHPGGVRSAVFWCKNTTSNRIWSSITRNCWHLTSNQSHIILMNTKHPLVWLSNSEPILSWVEITAHPWPPSSVICKGGEHSLLLSKG
jgi:hypothetical protein